MGRGRSSHRFVFSAGPSLFITLFDVIFVSFRFAPPRSDRVLRLVLMMLDQMKHRPVPPGSWSNAERDNHGRRISMGKEGAVKAGIPPEFMVHLCLQGAQHEMTGRDYCPLRRMQQVIGVLTAPEQGHSSCQQRPTSYDSHRVTISSTPAIMPQDVRSSLHNSLPD